MWHFVGTLGPSAALWFIPGRYRSAPKVRTIRRATPEEVNAACSLFGADRLRPMELRTMMGRAAERERNEREDANG